MRLSDLLREKSAAILQRWQCMALATYPEASRCAFQHERDPFANPVGHALRSGTRAAWEGLVAGRSADEIVACLDEIIKIRVVQEFKPSEAIAFVFSLKDAIRAELASVAERGCHAHARRGHVRQRPENQQHGQASLAMAPDRDPLRNRNELESEDPALAFSSELVDVEAQIDRIALGAFDVFARYRARICELRISEVKRSVGRYAQRMGRCGPLRESEEQPSPEGTSDCGPSQRGGSR